MNCAPVFVVVLKPGKVQFIVSSPAISSRNCAAETGATNYLHQRKLPITDHILGKARVTP